MITSPAVMTPSMNQSVIMTITQQVMILMRGGLNYLADSFIGQEVILTLDGDNDEKPDVLDFDGAEQLHASNSAENLDASIPFMVWYDGLPSTDSADLITAELTAGTDYTLEFSKNFSDPLGASSPHFEVTDPDGVILSQDIFTLSVYPEEHPSVICYTFTPETSGEYSFSVSNADPNLSADIDTASVLFVYKEMHNEAGENGYPVRFKLTDDTDTVSARNIIHLRKGILAANPVYIDYISGKTTTETQFEINDDTEDFDTWMSVIKSSEGIHDSGEDGKASASYEVTAAADYITLPHYLHDIPYDKRYSLGAGFMATTNINSYVSAFTEDSDLTIPVPEAKSGVETDFSYKFISTTEEYEQNISVNFAMSLSYNAVGGSSTVNCTDNFKFGLTSTMLVIHYDEIETTYRELKVANCELREQAKNLLNTDPASFRNKYGDYFVDAYQYGGVYNAFITITTETSEQLDSLKVSLEASLNGQTEKEGDAKYDFKTNLGSEIKTALSRSGAQINVRIKTLGAGDSTPESKVVPDNGNYSAIDSVLSQLTTFRNKLAGSFTPQSYAPITVRMRRYATLDEAASKIPETIPVTVDQRKSIENFNREILAMRGQYNFIDGIPQSNIQRSVVNSYKSRVDDIIKTITIEGNAFYEKFSLLNETMTKARNLKNELKALGDRYLFYRKLIIAQNNEPRGFFPRPGHISSGYTDFNTSPTVTSDIKAGFSKWEEFGYKVGKNRTWSPSYTATQKNGSSEAIFCFWKAYCAGYEDKRQVNNSPAVGKNQLSFTFQRGGAHDGYWTTTRRTMRFNSTLYPFNGLQQ